jgi:TolB protein
LDPLWSANNREVYFSSLEEIGNGVPARVLYALDLANLSRREVLRTGRVTGFPRISPDETLAVYHSQQGPKTKLFLQRPGDEGAEELATGLESPGYPVWLPDSSGILLEAEVGDSTQVFLMDVRTRRSIPITKSPGRHWPGSVSPDLRRVAFASLREGVWNVWWVDRQTGEEQMLTRYRSPRSFVRYPVWSPAGDRMVFEFAESKGNIYEVELR